jgi:hypothetical protein
MMNPMYYIGESGATSSHYWRIRHGAKDADTSLPIPVMLATKLMNTGHDVDFAVPWDRGYGGNYDLEELFDWIEAISEQAPWRESGSWIGDRTIESPIVGGATHFWAECSS